MVFNFNVKFFEYIRTKPDPKFIRPDLNLDYIKVHLDFPVERSAKYTFASCVLDTFK